MEEIAENYIRRCELHRVVDGDTIEVNIDLGFNQWNMHQSVRILDINAPEVRGPEREKGLESEEWLREKLLNADTIFIRTYKYRTGSFKRWLGELFADGVNVGQEMLELGLAKPYEKK